jgi:hypothetical protein
MNRLQPHPVLAQSVEGPVSGDDWVYASTMLEDVTRGAPGQVRQARLRLFADTEPAKHAASVADAVILLDSGSVICAGSVARTMRDAVDDLRHRLLGRLSLARARAVRRRRTSAEVQPQRCMTGAVTRTHGAGSTTNRSIRE